MELLDKKQLNDQFEKESTWMPKRLVSKLSYISGIEAFDTLLDGKLFTEVVALINLRLRPKGLQIQMMKGFKYHSVAIHNNEILNISLEPQSKLFELKDKSIVGRAIVGGLVFGPVGAIIGGMTGIGKKEVVKNLPENILSINFTEDGNDKIILFSCKDKDKREIERFLSKNYKIKFQVTETQTA